jgi:hypothetical protein
MHPVRKRGRNGHAARRIKRLAPSAAARCPPAARWRAARDAPPSHLSQLPAGTGWSNPQPRGMAAARGVHHGFWGSKVHSLTCEWRHRGAQGRACCASCSSSQRLRSQIEAWLSFSLRFISTRSPAACISHTDPCTRERASACGPHSCSRPIWSQRAGHLGTGRQRGGGGPHSKTLRSRLRLTDAAGPPAPARPGAAEPPLYI